MLRLILTASLCAGASAASASSIGPYTATGSERTSIVEIGCPACVREAAEKAAAEAEVKLGLGEQIIEVREVDGQMMIYRTEGWLGGSPVTMVRKASDMDLVALGVSQPSETQIADLPKAADDVAADQPMTAAAIIKTDMPRTATPVTEPVLVAPPLYKPVIANTAPGIDTEATTSALGIDTAEAAKPFDASKFELRLN
ncbi:plant virulence effector HPE1-like domain-containing protein [Hoeflea sp. G2-23]|uniref:Plant virulence effector HPE1-like domain-containing protein n=1 Tax=Hoeflea algicola TaxID=2983763 RepID=A0ABT3ZFE2_9HYPH|nr:plant virulence effector HPE1-like domain-containing protein [Hoeflea algicola]MCY0150494.1 plant virulence effector HPE1-like domain-containing protein [Hoeflea algicola]